MSDNLRTISFYSTVNANSEKTIVSERITSPYTVRSVQAQFAPNTENKLQLDFYICDEDNAPSSGRPSGHSICEEYGQVSYITGDDSAHTLLHEVLKPEAGSFLKVYANNTDNFEHSINVQITIEIMKRQEA